MNGASAPGVCLHGRYRNNPTFRFTHYETDSTFLVVTFTNQIFPDNDWLFHKPHKFKCRGKLSLCTPWMQEWRSQLQPFLMSAPDMYAVSFTPSMLYLQGKSPGTYWVCGRVGLHTLPLLEIKPQLLACPTSCPLTTVHRLHVTLKSHRMTQILPPNTVRHTRQQHKARHFHTK
jgi:hypothetical protein